MVFSDNHKLGNHVLRKKLKTREGSGASNNDDIGVGEKPI